MALRAVGMVVTLAAAVGGMSLVAWPAEATSCTSKMDYKAVPYDFDLYRAGATCSSVSSNVQVKAHLYRDGIDKYSGWFTRTNTYYYTLWYSFGTGSGYVTGPR